MTKRQFFLTLFLAAAAVFAVFVWPTRYEHIPPRSAEDGSTIAMRVDRFTNRVEELRSTGEWVEYAPPPPDYDVMDTEVGHEVTRARRAQEDIQKMNQVAQDAIDNGTIPK